MRTRGNAYARVNSPNQMRDPMSINDNLPSSSPSGKTMLKLLAAVVAIVVLITLYYNTVGF